MPSLAGSRLRLRHLQHYARLAGWPHGNGWRVGVHASSRFLATAGDDNRILIWDVGSGLTLRTIATPLLGFIAGVGVSGDSQTAVVASASGVYGFDVTTGTLKWQLHSGAVFATFSVEASRMAFYDGVKIKIVDTSNGQKVQEFSPGTEVPSALALSPDGQKLAVGSGDHLTSIGEPSKNGVPNRGVSIYSTSTGAIQEVLAVPEQWSSAVAFNETGNEITAIAYDGSAFEAKDLSLQLWKGKPFAASAPVLLPDRATMSQALNFADDGSTLIIGEGSNNLLNGQDVMLYDVNGVFRPLNDPIGPVWHLSLSSRTGDWAGSGRSAAIGIWDSHTGALLDLLPTQRERSMTFLLWEREAHNSSRNPGEVCIRWTSRRRES